MPYTASAVAGSTLKFTVATVLTVVKGANSVTLGGGERTDINVTGIDDTTEVFVGGRRAARELTFSLAHDPTDTVHAAMRTNYLAGTATPVAISLTDVSPTPKVRTFSGYIKKFEETFGRDEALIANVTIKLTTDVTYT